MSLIITDDQLRDAGLAAQEARVEIACRLYFAEKLSMPAAVKWSGLTRVQFEEALLARDLWLVKPSIEDVEPDIAALRDAESAH